MLEPKGGRKSCSQIKTVAPNKISDQNSCLPPPCKSPTHHHHPFAHSSCLPLSCESPPPAPPLQSPASHRTQLHIPTPLATSCRSSTGGAFATRFLPAHSFPRPVAKCHTPEIQIPASFANALRTTPYCKSPPPPLLQIPARPSEFPPLPIPPRRNPPAPPLPPFLQIPASPTPFFQTCALKSAWSTCLQTFSAKLPLVDSCCSTQSMSAIVCSRRRQALFKWAARRLQAADPFHLGGCNGLQVGCKEAAPRSHRRDRWTTTRVPYVFSIIYSVLHVDDLNVVSTGT